MVNLNLKCCLLIFFLTEVKYLLKKKMNLLIFDDICIVSYGYYLNYIVYVWFNFTYKALTFILDRFNEMENTTKNTALPDSSKPQSNKS